MKTYEVTLYKKYTINLPDDSTEVDALEEAEQSEYSIGTLDFVEIDGEEMR